MPVPVNDVVDIERAGETFVRAINAGDISALSDFFAPKAVILPPARAAIQGANVATFLRNMAMQNEGLRMMSSDMEPLGPDAVRETGTLSMRVKQRKAERVAYKYLMIWQRQGPAWKLSSLVWNRAPADRNAADTAGGDGEM